MKSPYLHYWQGHLPPLRPGGFDVGLETVPRLVIIDHPEASHLRNDGA